MQKNATIPKRLAEILVRQGLDPGRYSVLRELRCTLILLDKDTKAVSVIDKN